MALRVRTPRVYVAAAGGSITGAGSLSIGAPSLAGTGSVPIMATILQARDAGINLPGPSWNGQALISVFPGDLGSLITGQFYFYPEGLDQGRIIIGAPSLAGTGTFTAPTFTGQGSLIIGAPALAGTGTAAGPSFTGAGSLVIGGPSLVGTGTVDAPVFTGQGSVTIGGPALAGTGTADAPVFSGQGFLLIGGPALSGTGDVTAPTFSGEGSLTIGAPSLAGTGSFTESGTASGEGALVIGMAALTGAGTAIAPSFTGAGSVIIGAPTFAGSDTVAPETAQGGFVISAPTFSGRGTAGVATSGRYNYRPAFHEILQDAVGMVGGGPILAEELLSAKRGLDILLTQIQNRNVLLHKIETVDIPCVAGQSVYTLDNSILDVLHAGIQTQSGSVVTMSRQGYERWAELPTKSQSGRPISYWFDRRQHGNNLNVWPVPSDSSATIVLTVQKNTEDTVRAFDNVDMPRRFIPALTYGLAYWIGLRRSSRVSLQKLQLLKTEFDRAVQEGMREDRERAPTFIRAGR